MTKSPFNRSPQKGEQGNSPKVIIKQALPSLPKWIKSAASKGCSIKGNAGRGQSTPPKFEQSSANNDSSHLLFRSPRKKSQIKSTRSKRINAIKAHQLYYSLILALRLGPEYYRHNAHSETKYPCNTIHEHEKAHTKINFINFLVIQCHKSGESIKQTTLSWQDGTLPPFHARLRTLCWWLPRVLLLGPCNDGPFLPHHWFDLCHLSCAEVALSSSLIWGPDIHFYLCVLILSCYFISSV